MRDETPTGVKDSGMDEIAQILNEVDESNPLKSVVEQLLDRIERVELSRDAAHKRIDDLEEQLHGNNPEGSDTEDTDVDDTQDSLLPIERLSRLKQDESEDNPFADTTPSVDRAVTIFEHFRDWSSKAPKGRVITNGLKNLIETATGENLYWSQIRRAAEKLEEYSKGSIVFKKTSRHGNVLIAEKQSVLAGTG